MYLLSLQSIYMMAMLRWLRGRAYHEFSHL